MSDITKKYKRLAEAALQLIETDNILIAAVKAGDVGGEQVARINRVQPLMKVQQLAEWTPADS